MDRVSLSAQHFSSSLREVLLHDMIYTSITDLSVTSSPNIRRSHTYHLSIRSSDPTSFVSQPLTWITAYDIDLQSQHHTGCALRLVC